MFLGQIGGRQAGGLLCVDQLAQQRRHAGGGRGHGGIGDGEAAALAVGVGRFVEGVQRAKDGAGMGIDQIDPPQVPAGIAHRGPFQCAVAGGDFEACPLQAQCAVAAALGAHRLDAERLPQSLAAGAFAPGLGAVDEAVDKLG